MPPGVVVDGVAAQLALKELSHAGSRRLTYRLVEHARLPVLVLSLGTVHETVAEDVVVYAPISSLAIRRGARESLHSVHGWWTLCNVAETKVH